MRGKILHFVLLVHIANKINGIEDRRVGPVFIYQPPKRVEFMNDTGAIVDCSAHGVPEANVHWIKSDGRPVSSHSNLLRVASNGSLIFSPFHIDDYHQQIHSTIYTCVAENRFGRILSRPVKIRAGVRQSYQAQVYDEYVIQGNTAIIKFHIPSYVKDDVFIQSWIRDDNFVIRKEQPAGSRYSILSNGNLHIRNVMETDTYKSYSCRTIHRLTKKTQRSITSGRLVVTKPQNSIPPRLMDSEVEIRAEKGSNIELPCAAQGYPPPTYHWFIQDGDDDDDGGGDGGSFQKIERPVVQLRGSLFIKSIELDDSRTYICYVNNSVGYQTSTTEVIVTAPLNVYITPQSQTVNSGKSAIFDCFVTGFPVLEVKWLKDGHRIKESESRAKVINQTNLQVDSLQRSDEGMYQCFVSGDDEIQQAASLLLLGDLEPIIHKSFEDDVYRPGQDINLSCTASGRPLPSIVWFFDDQPITNRQTLMTNSEVVSHEKVSSYLNITQIRTEDGGYYKCEGVNQVGKSSHSAKISVYGPVKVKMHQNITVVESKDLVLKCFVSGYPITSIQWQSAGTILKDSGRISLFPNGTVVLRKVKKNVDEGRYTCVARGASGDISTGFIWVNVVVKPQISPMALPKHILEGMQVVIFCSVVQGDQPVKKVWLKDGHFIPSELGILIGDNRVYSALEIKSVQSIHSGNYTCIASNAAGKSSESVNLLVEAPPVWDIIPEDKLAFPGESVMFNCRGEGIPQPMSSWKVFRSGTYKPLPKVSRFQVLDNGTLLIEELAAEDETSYMCEVRNGLDPGISKKVKLEFGSQPLLRTNSNSITASSRKPVQIKCQAKGVGKMNISWMKDGHNLILTENKYSISEMKVGMIRTSKVILLNPSLSDSGVYTCTLTSSFGKQMKNTHVTIQEPPGKIINFRVKIINSTSWKLRWEEDGDETSSWYIVKYKNKSDPWDGQSKLAEVVDRQLIIGNIARDTSMVFKIYGVNDVDEGEHQEFTYSSPIKKSGVVMMDSPIMNQSSQESVKVPLLLIVVPVVTAMSALVLIIFVVFFIRKKDTSQANNIKKTTCTDDQFTLRSIGVQESDQNQENLQMMKASKQIPAEPRYGTLNRNDYYCNSGDYITPYASFPPQDIKMTSSNCDV